jgi:hypothetical protein
LNRSSEVIRQFCCSNRPLNFVPISSHQIFPHFFFCGKESISQQKSINPVLL